MRNTAFVTTVGLRELRQQASDLVRRVEDGEQVLITVDGRPSARLVPVSPRAWRSWDEVADLFAGPADQQWASDRDRLDDTVREDDETATSGPVGGQRQPLPGAGRQHPGAGVALRRAVSRRAI